MWKTIINNFKKSLFGDKQKTANKNFSVPKSTGGAAEKTSVAKAPERQDPPGFANLMSWTRLPADAYQSMVSTGEVKDLQAKSERWNGGEKRVINSTAIDKVSYDPSDGGMTLTFQSNPAKEYFYPEVPNSMFAQFMGSSSKGKAYHKLFRNWGKWIDL